MGIRERDETSQADPLGQAELEHGTGRGLHDLGSVLKIIQGRTIQNLPRLGGVGGGSTAQFLETL